MKRTARPSRFSKRRGFLRDQSGVAAIEFALISTAMFAMLSGAVDLTQAITIQRDLNRFTTEAAQVLAACKDKDKCFILTMQAIDARRANIVPKLQAMELGMARFTRKDSRFDDIGGTMTYLPASMNTEALDRLEEGDKGVAVRATYIHRPIILGFADNWGFTTKTFSASKVVLSWRP